VKILVALSGGIDSAAVAYKLKNEGHNIEGVYMKLHNSLTYHEENIKKVAKISKNLQIKYHILDLSEKFEKAVYLPFIESYKKGETPNPCILCNKLIKFGELVEFAKKKGFDKLATGHYASICGDFICEAKDKTKDQSYFLADIKKEYIPYLLFPLSNTTKEELKENISKIDEMKEYKKQKESQEICFVDTTYVDILKQHTNVEIAGKVLNQEGKVIGEHKGYMRYTVGQRKGFTVFIAHEPHYVLSTNPKKNEIVVGKKKNLEVTSFFIKDINIFIEKKSFDSTVKIRYRSEKTPCQVELTSLTTAKVTLKKPVFALAKGQMAVFYEGEKVIGGGWII